MLATIVILVIGITLFMLFSALWTEKLWFDNVGFTQVFLTQLVVRVGLFAIGFVIMGVSVWLNMMIAYNRRPRARRVGASAVLDRYRDLLESNLLLTLLLPAGVFGVMAGLSTSTQTLQVLAWMNRTPTGTVDPYFNLDVSFFLLEYPLWRMALSVLMSALVFGGIAALAVHFAVGNVLTGRPGQQVMPAAVRHLSIMGGLIVAVYGLEQLLQRYGLLLDQGTLYTGMHYTDHHARITAKLVVAVAAFIVAVLFFVNSVLNKTYIPVAGVVLMLVSGLILSLIYPVVIQTFSVKPNEPDKEGPYISAHMEMTKQAYGLTALDPTEYEAVTKVQPGQLRNDAAALPGIRLMDPDVIGPTFDQLQQVRGYYAFPSVLDVNRYTVDGKETDVVVAARELDLKGIPDRNWNNLHTVFTHGHGLVSAYGNRRQTLGEPEWITKDIPPVGKIEQTQSRVYHGEESEQFVIVGREEGQEPIELDSPGGAEGGGEQYNVYDGEGGVGMGNMWRRLLFAARFSDVNILLSDRINSQSKVLYNRTPRERVERVAPWLTVDSNLYPAIVDGRLVWIVDAYTTAATYPNSQQVSFAQATVDVQTQALGGQMDKRINYIRNSVKAVVDAYDGTVTLYAWDDTDPLLKAYSKAFPGSVKPRSEISDDLLRHLRYPEDLFKVQRDILASYHVNNSYVWYGGTDLWEVPVDPVRGNNQIKERPYYLSIKWPGDSEPIFSQTSVYVPKNRANLAAYLAVNADAAHPDYGKMRMLRMSDTHQIDGPGQTQNAITQNPSVASRLLPYQENRGAASVTFGNLLTLPMGNGLLYVEPIYTERTGNAGSYPALTFVVVRFGEHVGIGVTLQEALDEVFGGDAGADTGETPVDDPEAPQPEEPGEEGEETTGSTTVNDAAVRVQLKKAQNAFKEADAALKDGDLATYQQKNKEAAKAINDAAEALGR